MRSRGQVRFIKVSTGKQLAAVGTTVTVAGALLASVAGLGIARVADQEESAALQAREARVAAAETRMREARDDFDSVTDDLARRQKFIEEMVQAHVVDLPADDVDAQATGPEGENATKISAAVPRATALNSIAAEQDDFVARLTAFADARAAKAESEIRKLGLNPRILMASVQRGARGGPLEKLATRANGTVDENFRRMGASLARMDALQASLESVPQVMPASVDYRSSSYGYRADPFTGAAAFHSGIDFPGPLGSPIYAAAPGRVSYVGRRSGYGNVVEIDHGNGLMTRYAHLSRFGAHVGAKVDGGSVIARMGSTGRSTGSHLHFEVRVNGRAVNPRPFLESSQRN